MLKFASFEILSAEFGGGRSNRRQAARAAGLPSSLTSTIRVDAHRASFDYERRPGYLYVRSRAISSRCNDNYDEFPAHEIEAAYRSFLGKPVFVNHANANHRTARGVIIDAALHKDSNRDGSPDVWVEVLMEVDAVRFPMLAKAIMAGEVDRTSMGADVAFSVCSACGNKAYNPAQYCVPSGERVWMADGTYRRIEDVRLGDEVLTHAGSARVSKVFQRHYRGPLARVTRVGYSTPFRVTHGHPILGFFDQVDGAQSGGVRYRDLDNSDTWTWGPSEELRPDHWVMGRYPTRESDFSIDILSLAADFREVDGNVVLATSTTAGRKRKLSEDQVASIKDDLKNGLGGASIAQSHGVSPALVSNIKHGKTYGPVSDRTAWTRSGLARYVGSSEALATLLGWYVAEGSVENFSPEGTPKVVAWSLNVSEGWAADEIDDALADLGIQETKRYVRRGTQCLVVKVSNAPLAALLCRLGGKTDASHRAQKMLAPEVLTMSIPLQRRMLRAYGHGDGWDSPGGRVECRTASEELARQLFVIGARVYEMLPTWWRREDNLGGPLSREKTSVIHHVRIDDGARMAGRRRRAEGSFSNRVVDVQEEQYHGEVYNLEVEEDHSYVVEGVVVHNCQHIPKMKGHTYRRYNAATGSGENVLIREICHGLKFFENSLLVEDPADPTALGGRALGDIGLNWKGKELGHPAPGESSTDGADDRSRHAKLLSDLVQGQGTPLALAQADLRQQASYLSDVGLGQHGLGVDGSTSTSGFGDHVGGVVGIGSQEPVRRVLTEGNITGVAHHHAFRDGTHQDGVAVPMAAHTGSLGVGQTEAAISVVGKDRPRPEVTGVRTTTGVDLAQVSLDLGGGAHPASGREASFHGGQLTVDEWGAVHVAGAESYGPEYADYQRQVGGPRRVGPDFMEHSEEAVPVPPSERTIEETRAWDALKPQAECPNGPGPGGAHSIPVKRLAPPSNHRPNSLSVDRWGAIHEAAIEDDLTSKTPFEVDSALAGHHERATRAEAASEHDLDSMHWTVGDSKKTDRFNPKRQVWGKAQFEEGKRRHGQHLDEEREARGEISRHNDEYQRRGGWSRFFLQKIKNGGEFYAHKPPKPPKTPKTSSYVVDEWGTVHEGTLSGPLYHGTTSDRADAVQREGFRPGTDEHRGAVWFTPHLDLARTHAEGRAAREGGTPAIISVERVEGRPSDYVGFARSRESGAAYSNLGAEVAVHDPRAIKGVTRVAKNGPEPAVVSPEEYHAAYSRAVHGTPFEGHITEYQPHEIRDRKMTPLLSHGGGAGMLVLPHENGDVEGASLFRHQDAPKGAGLALLDHAVRHHGVNYVEAFEGPLSEMYRGRGFHTDEKIPFSDEYAKPGWDYDRFGRPPVHIMRRGSLVVGRWGDVRQRVVDSAERLLGEPYVSFDDSTIADDYVDRFGTAHPALGRILHHLKRGSRSFPDPGFEQSDYDDWRVPENDQVGEGPAVPGLRTTDFRAGRPPRPRNNIKLNSANFDAVEEGRSPMEGAARSAVDYRRLHGLPEDHADYSRVRADPERHSRIADAYEAAPLKDENARPAYEAMAREVGQQYDHMVRGGLKVHFQDEDPYRNHRELADEVGRTGTLKVLRTAATKDSSGGHPFLSDEDNDKFRAVHDYYGHLATGRPFDKHGEEAAWRHHSTMFTPLARRAMTTDTRGQNAMLHRHGEFPQQKGALLPEEFSNDEALVGTKMALTATQYVGDDVFHFHPANPKEMGGTHEHTLEAWDRMDEEHFPEWTSARPNDRASLHGSHLDPGARPVGSISWAHKDGEIEGIYTRQDRQRQGVATELLRRAREVSQETRGVREPRHSTHRTNAGDAWASTTGDRLPKRWTPRGSFGQPEPAFGRSSVRVTANSIMSPDEIAAAAQPDPLPEPSKGGGGGGGGGNPLGDLMGGGGGGEAAGGAGGAGEVAELAALATKGFLTNPADRTNDWYHGTPRDFESFDQDPDEEDDDYDEEPYERQPHWNTHLGQHWTSLKGVAKQFARGKYNNVAEEGREGHVFTANLGVKTPKRYESESTMDREAFNRAWPMHETFDPDDVHARHCKNEDCYGLDEHPRGDSVDRKVRAYYGSSLNAGGWVSQHPDSGSIALGFKRHLQQQGHDGVVYGNEVEGPRGHKCAITFDTDQIRNHRRVLEHEARRRQAAPPGMLGSRNQAKLAYGDTVAPPEVDTLREDICPVCGEHDSYNGDKCSVCGFVKPPSLFMDPDVQVAQNLDLRSEQNDESAALPEGSPEADLFCPVCGSEFTSAEEDNALGEPHGAPAGQQDGDTLDDAEAEAEEVEAEERQRPPRGPQKPAGGPSDAEAEEDDDEEDRGPEGGKGGPPKKLVGPRPDDVAAEKIQGDRQVQDDNGYAEGDACPVCGRGVLEPIESQEDDGPPEEEEDSQSDEGEPEGSIAGYSEPDDKQFKGRTSALDPAFVRSVAAAAKKAPGVAGLVVKAEDTGRILMLQRSLSGVPKDKAAGCWEFPGGHAEEGETPFDAARREWQEETGCGLPNGRMTGSWVSSNGVYQGFVYLVPQEKAIKINPDGGRVRNPDGDLFEACAWWRPTDAQDNPALRRECKGCDWDLIKRSK